MQLGVRISGEQRLLASVLKDPTARRCRFRGDRRDDRRIEIGRKGGVMKGGERVQMR